MDDGATRYEHVPENLPLKLGSLIVTRFFQALPITHTRTIATLTAHITLAHTGSRSEPRLRAGLSVDSWLWYKNLTDASVIYKQTDQYIDDPSTCWKLWKPNSSAGIMLFTLPPQAATVWRRPCLLQRSCRNNHSLVCVLQLLMYDQQMYNPPPYPDMPIPSLDTLRERREFVVICHTLHLSVYALYNVIIRTRTVYNVLHQNDGLY